MNAMSAQTGKNYFELFGLAPRFLIDLDRLETSFRQLQFEFHPDRYAGQPEDMQRLALRQSSEVNHGYQILRHPVSRARCLMQLAGSVADADVSQGFLLSQIEWREAIEEARANENVDALNALMQRLKRKISFNEKELAAALDVRGDFTEAAQRMVELSFYDKLRTGINDVLNALDSK